MDPVNLYCAPVEALTSKPPDPTSSFEIWPRLKIMEDMWLDGGITSDRLAVMDRAATPKTALLSRQKGRAAGAAFLSRHNSIAMIHALEINRSLRRSGGGTNMMRAAAIWAQNNGAGYISLAVTTNNTAANALYTGLGMTIVGKYHYRLGRN